MSEQFSLAWDPPRRQFTVTELTANIAALLSTEFTGIWVAGEVSGLKLAASGHAYFTLKDQGSQIRCACWKGAYRLLRAKPRDGLAVLARGRVEVYEPRGEYQLIVEAIEPLGHGALQLAFEELKRTLAAEGLFDRKRPLPRLPRSIGIVTSPAGAVIRDMLHVFERRFPGLHIRIYPAQVQGAGSVDQIVEGLEYFAQSGWPDVIVLARGGGSLEDLWSFNEEAVARAIFNSPIPVVSAIGHETDFTIADFVADLRAPTPSAAAEILTATREGMIERIETAQWKLAQAMRYRLSQAGRRWSAVGVAGVRASIERRLHRAGQRVDEAGFRLRALTADRLAHSRSRWQGLEIRLRRLDLRLRFAADRRRLEIAEAALSAALRRRLTEAARRRERLNDALERLSPLGILERGYAVVRRENGGVLLDPAEAADGETLRVRLARGELRVKAIH